MLNEIMHSQYKGANKLIKLEEKLKRTRSAANVETCFQIPQFSINTPTCSTSFIVRQKLRRSKWFTHEEMGIFCAVVESGFIVEKKIDDPQNIYGIVIWVQGCEKTKNPNYIKIYTTQPDKGNFKIVQLPLLEFWRNETLLRINNQPDQTNKPHSESIIKDQLAYAEKNKQKWHNSEHFTYWCRYGPPQINYRIKQMSATLKWGSVGHNTGLLFLKRIRKNASKY